MSALLGPNGQPIHSNAFKKAPAPQTGPAFGNWAGREGLNYTTMPGGGVLGFDLSRLTLQDFRVMRDHYQVNASLTVLQFMLHRLDWRIECDDEKISDFIEENIRQVWTRMIRALSQAYWAGYSPIVIEYENDPQAGSGRGGIVISKFKDLPPEESRVNWKQVEGYAPPGRMPPKFKVYDGIKHMASPDWPIPPENTVWYSLLMENGDFYGKKLLRAAFTPWYFSTIIHLFANRYFERFGEPLPVGRAPYDDDIEVGGHTVNGRDAMLDILTQLRSRGVVVLPSDKDNFGGGGTGNSDYLYDIEYLESQMRGADFEAYLSRLDEEITLGLFTPFLLLRGASGGGSYSLGVQQMQMYLWMLNALAGDMKEYIDFYVVKRLKDYNFGPNAPRATWEFRQLGKENVETMRAVVQALVSKGDIKPDIAQLGSIIGLSLEDISDLQKPDDDPDPTLGVDDPNTDDSDPTIDPTAGKDDRVRIRDDRNKPKNAPRSADAPGKAGKQVTARIRGQVENAFRRGTFGVSFAPSLGYRRLFEQSLVAEGADKVTAHEMTERLYERVEDWMREVISIGPEAFGAAGVDGFMELFERMLQTEIESLVEPR